MKFTSRLGQVSNEKKGKLKLPPYHPMHKNPFYYDDQVQEIYDANGVKKRDKVDIVRKGVEGKCSKLLISTSIPGSRPARRSGCPWFEQNKAYLHFLQNQSSQKLTQLRTKQAELPMKNYEKEICESVAQSSQVEFIDLLLSDV